MKNSTVCLVILVLVIYVVVGGVVFHYLERGGEEDAQTSVLAAQDIILGNNTCLSREDLFNFIKAVQAASDAGISLRKNATSPSNWDMPSSVFFATTVVTTIGYGNISPTSFGGRIFCTVFALLGIPLFLVATALIADKMKLELQSLYTRGKRCHSKQYWHITLAISSSVLILGLFIFLPSLVFHLVEDWTYSESLYYSFITLTTIGFGDFVAGSNTDIDSNGRGVYRIFVAFWILVGLAWMATVITIIQGAITNNVQKKDEETSEEMDEPRDKITLENGLSTQAKGSPEPVI